MWHVLRGLNIHVYCFQLTVFLTLNFQDGQTEGGETFKATGLSIFYVQQFVSNSHFLLFHRAQNRVEYQGFARNWDKSGYIEVIHTPRKLG